MRHECKEEDYIALDIESTPKEEYMDFDRAALDFNRNLISVVGCFDGREYYSTSNLSSLSLISNAPLIMQNGKWDMKVLLSHGAPLSLAQYREDTQLQAVTFPHKIPEQWLAEYEAKRKVLNKAAGKTIHREAGKYSLKSMAPYFLGVAPFWETEDHSDLNYNELDCRHTHALWKFFNAELKYIGAHDFYQNHLMKWARTFCEAELRGVALDFDKITLYEGEYGEQARRSQAEMMANWGIHFNRFEEERRTSIFSSYASRRQVALDKLAPSKKKDPEKAAQEDNEKYEKTHARYTEMAIKAAEKVEPFNMASPPQLKWLLKDCLGLDITDYHGEETTDKAVLQALFDKGEDQLGPLLEYRTAQKVITSYFPGYHRMQYNGIIHPSFNLDIARTGRTSSSDPNFQNISKKIQSVFKARPGYKFAYADVSAVEPRIIAYVTECPELCKIFINGTDFHSENVRVMMGINKGDAAIKEQHKAEREFIKAFGLSLMYGARSKRIEQEALKKRFPRSPQQCENDYENFRRKYRVVFEYKDELERQIKAGEIITNIFGRPLNFEGTNLKMTSLNTAMQSAGSDILLESWSNALIECRSKGLEVHPIGTIHDAGIIEAPEDQVEEVLAILMNNIASWQFPTKYGNIPVISDGFVKDHL